MIGERVTHDKIHEKLLSTEFRTDGESVVYKARDMTRFLSGNYFEISE